MEKNRIKIKHGDKEVDPEYLYKRGIRLVERFHELYIVYKDLRDKGFVLRRGLKFGCDYLVYVYGPGIDHAPYGLQVYSIKDRVNPIEYVRMGRLLHSVRKKLVIALVDEKDNIEYILFSWWKP